MSKYGVNYNRAELVRHTTYGRDMRAPIAAALDWGNETLSAILQYVRSEMNETLTKALERLQGKWTKETIALTYLLYGENWELDEYCRKKADELDVIFRKGELAMRLEELRLADILSETTILNDRELARIMEKNDSRICDADLSEISDRPGFFTLSFVSAKEKQREVEVDA